MSFIYRDKNLINNLLQAVETEQMKKKAQFALEGAPVGQPSAQDLLQASQIAKPLLVRLQQQVDPKSAPPVFKGIPLGTDPSNPNPVAKVENFRTLGDFIQWAAQNKLTWDGRRFAWTANEKADALANKALEFTSFPRNRDDRDPVSRDVNKVEVYALKEPLKSYLSYLRDNDARTNKVLEVMLKAIIEEINSKLTGEPISSKAAPKPETLELNLDDEVDGFDSEILDFNNWEEGLNRAPTFVGSRILLTVRDLSSQPDFLNWLSKFKIKSIGADNKEVINPVISPKHDPCVAVHILYKRAQYLNNVVAKAQKDEGAYAKITEFYLKSVQQYGAQLNGVDGKPCPVTSLPAPATTGVPGAGVPGAVPGTPGAGVPGAGVPGTGVPGAGGAGTGAGGTGSGAGGGAGAGGAGTGAGGVGGAGGRGTSQQQLRQKLESAVAALPLSREVVSFSEINMFLTQMQGLLDSQTYETYVQPITQAMTKANSLTRSPNMNLNLGDTPNQIAEDLIRPAFTYCNYMSQMMIVVTNTMRIIRAFKRQYENELQTNPSWYQPVLGQVGSSDTSYSIGLANRNSINSLMSSYCKGKLNLGQLS